MWNMKLILATVLTTFGASLKLSMIGSPKKVAIVGSTGYIGKFVVKESSRRGYETLAVVR